MQRANDDQPRIRHRTFRSTERSKRKVNLYLSFQFLPRRRRHIVLSTQLSMQDSHVLLQRVLHTIVQYIQHTIHLAYSTFSIPASQSLCWLSLMPLPSHKSKLYLNKSNAPLCPNPFQASDPEFHQCHCGDVSPSRPSSIFVHVATSIDDSPA